MSVALGRDKELPVIPDEANSSNSSVDKLMTPDELSLPSLEIESFARRNKILPSIKVETALSEQQIDRLHEIWNETGLSARAHRKRYRNQNTPRRIPAPIAIPDAKDMATLSSSSTDPSVTSGIPHTPRSRRRWGFLSGKSSSGTQEAEKKPGTLKVLRAMAQDRLKKKIRYTKSTPDLSERVTRLSVAPMSVVAIPNDGGTNDSSISSPPSKSATPEDGIPPEDVDANAIYFTLDPNSRFSQGSVRFQPITPVPGSTAFGRPDSPLLHRHHSLDQLSFAAQQAAMTGAMELALEYPGDEVFRLIEEIETYLEL